MSFKSSSNEQNVFANSQHQPRFKAATAVLPPPPMGLGQPKGFAVPPFVGLTDINSYTKSLPAFHGLNVGPTYSKAMDIDRPSREDEQFPSFDGEIQSIFGFMSDDEPAMLFHNLQRALEFTENVDSYRVEGESNLIRGRFFGKLNNAEYEVRVFGLSGREGSCAQFNRFCGDGWEFSNFVAQILREFKQDIAQRPRFPALPPLPGQNEPSVEDFTALLVDVEQSYQDIAEHSAAELATQTQNDSWKQLCDRIEGFCPRVLQILEGSSNCAIVRSLVICLTNMAQVDGLTKRILQQQSLILSGVNQKWTAEQAMCGGQYKIAPSQEVTRHIGRLLLQL